jgi:hypothetical protein
MEVYIFVSTAWPSVKAFASDMSGANLPAAYAPWRAANGGNAVLNGSAADPIGRAVKRDGYFLLSGKGQRSFQTEGRSMIRSARRGWAAGGILAV